MIEHRSCITEYEQAVGCTVQVVRLRASGTVLTARLSDRHRNDREGLAWHLSRAPELDAILDAQEVADFDIDTAGRSDLAVASDRRIPTSCGRMPGGIRNLTSVAERQRPGK